MSGNDQVEAPTRQRSGVVMRVAAQMLAACVVVAVTAAAVVGLHLRAGAQDAGAPQPPLSVEVTEARLLDGYETSTSYLGRIEPARQTRIAFERAGLVTEVLVEEGDRVAPGDPLARLDQSVLEAERDRLTAERDRLTAQLELAERTTRRQERLAGRGFSSDQQFDEARFEADALRAQIASVGAQLRSVDIELEKSTLAAPFDGVVSSRSLDEGAVVAPGAEVAMLQEVSRPQLRLGLPPEAAERLALGDAYPARSGGRRFDARLLSVAPDLDPAVRTVTALFAVETADDAPAPPMGEVARVTLRERVRARGAWLPLAALREGREGLWTVFTVVADPERADGFRIGQEAAQILAIEGDQVFVSGTLEDGAVVVVSGLNRVVRGQVAAPRAAATAEATR